MRKKLIEALKEAQDYCLSRDCTKCVINDICKLGELGIDHMEIPNE